MVQAALYQLVLDRKLGEGELPKGPCSLPAATGRLTAAWCTGCPRSDRLYQIRLRFNEITKF